MDACVCVCGQKANLNAQNAGAVHITDLAAFYKLLVEHILDDAKIPSGREGYYFAVAHTISSWALMQGLADRLYARGLIEEAQPQEWVSDEAAAASIGAPVPIVRVMGTHKYVLTPLSSNLLLCRTFAD